MRPKYTRIDKETEFVNEGYNNYIQNIEIDFVDRADIDGLLSLCIDSRIAVTQICEHFNSKEPISTAGNVLTKKIRKLPYFTNKNVLVTHGIHPDLNKAKKPSCGGHALVFEEDERNYKTIIRNLKPYVKTSYNNYDAFKTTENLAKIWQAADARFYDHSTGTLYDLQNHKMQLGIDPNSQHSGLNPIKGQDPTLIVINTLGKPFNKVTNGRGVKEIGGIIEIFYPETNLPESIIESLIYCLQNHYTQKYAFSNDFVSFEEGQFRSSDTLVFLADSESGIKQITKSLLSVRNKNHHKLIEGFFKDPKDIIIGIEPEHDRKIIEITAK